jgi:hypothetical protein
MSDLGSKVVKHLDSKLELLSQSVLIITWSYIVLNIFCGSKGNI